MVIIDSWDKNIISVNEEKEAFRFYTQKSKDLGSKAVLVYCRIYLKSSEAWDDINIAEYPSEKDAENAMRKVADLLREKAPVVDFAIIH